MMEYFGLFLLMVGAPIAVALAIALADLRRAR